MFNEVVFSIKTSGFLDLMRENLLKELINITVVVKSMQHNSLSYLN